MYLVLSLLYEKIIDEEHSFEMGFYRWGKVRPLMLEKIGLSEDVWTKMSDFGDENEILQQRLEKMRQKYGNITLDQLLKNPNVIRFDKKN
jgi:hypothetical protein